MKTASGCYEVRGKKLGIVGYGNIGSQLSVLAESLGMEVYYYDVVEKLALGNARRCRTLAELLKRSDIVTLHVDGRSANRNLISAKEFAMMKKGGIFLNLSRGHVVDIEALAAALKSEKLAGAAIDVFPYEPKSNKEEFISKLRGLPNVLLTPHIGGSTVEAQQNIGEYVASRLVEYVNMGGSFNSVNFPQIQLPSLQGAHRLLHIHRNVPGILAQINGILARNKINILGQYLKTNEQIGYVITDVNRKYHEAVIQELRSIPDTIKFRILY
jgi:D-3-phosphoglycerate dehydrogenase